MAIHLATPPRLRPRLPMPKHLASPIGPGRILVVDDEPANVRLLARILEDGGAQHVRTTTDPLAVVPLSREFDPDLVVLDLHMPVRDGYEVMRDLAAAFPEGEYLPILVVTADATERTRRRALAAGARDFLTKPFNATEALLRMRNLLETRALYRELQVRNEALASQVEERTRELETARLEVLERLCQAVEFRDDVTGRHTRRVGELSAALAAALGMPEAEVDVIRRAAPLHDVGKIGIPDAILLKRGPLTPEEFAVMQRHTVLGARILAGGATPLMAAAEAIAMSHHEKWDGSGYPAGAAGSEIPLVARIVAVVDVFDAVTTPRLYRTAWPTDLALEEIRNGAARHFDPEVVAAFLALQGDTLKAMPSERYDTVISSSLVGNEFR